MTNAIVMNNVVFIAIESVGNRIVINILRPFEGVFRLRIYTNRTFYSARTQIDEKCQPLSNATYQRLLMSSESLPH